MTAFARTILCVLALAVTAPAAPLLSVDFNCRTNVNVAPGFTSFLINSNGSASSAQTNPTVRVVGPLRMTLTGNGFNPGYTDSGRAVPTNQGAFTESLLLRDCVYSRDSSPQGGLNLQIDNLPPSNRVQVTLWSFEALSQPVRASDWFANGVLVRADYRFTNSVPPVSNDQYRFSFVSTVSATGQLLIQGRRNAASVNEISNPHAGVFLNAIRIDPEPLAIVRLEAGAEMRLTFVVWPQPGQYEVEEFTGGQWRLLTSVILSPPVDNRVTARFARPGTLRLYRIRYTY